jgi:hypothetical protein
MAGMSKLQAVNLMLSNIGESPVSTLSGSSGDAFVATAIVILDETCRSVQNDRWEFNFDSDYLLTPDGSSNILITDDMLSVDTSSRSGSVDVTVRAGKLYDKTNQTFVFTDSLYCDVTWEFAYEDCPQYIRQYVAIKAARVFARRMLGDTTGQQLTAEDEIYARGNAKRAELKNADRNMMEGSLSGPGAGVARMHNRRI